MKFTNKEALQFHKECTSHLPLQSPLNIKINTTVKRFIDEYIDECSEIHQREYYRKFLNLVSRKQRRPDAFWNETIFFESPSEDETTKDTGGRPLSFLGDGPCPKKSKTILKDAVRFIEDFALDQKLTREEALKVITKECNRVWKTKSTETKATIPPTDATALIYNANISLNQYQFLRSVCLPHGVIFPTRNTIDRVKRCLHPPILSCELKSSVDFESLLSDTASALISLNYNHEKDDREVFTLTGKFGVDGSGSHKIRHQLINKEKAQDETPHLNPEQQNSILLSCYVPLSLGIDGVNIWENPLPNSTIYARPVQITRGKEERSVVREEFVPIYDLIKRSPCIALNELHKVKCITKWLTENGRTHTGRHRGILSSL